MDHSVIVKALSSVTRRVLWICSGNGWAAVGPHAAFGTDCGVHDPSPPWTGGETSTALHCSLFQTQDFHTCEICFHSFIM